MATKVTQKLVFELSGDPSGVKNAFDKINRDAKKTGEAIGVGITKGAKKGTGALKRMAEIASGVIVSQLVNRGFGALKNEIGAAIRETAQLEYSVKKAAAVMGSGYDELMAKARQVGAETAYTAQQAAGGLYMLASQGHDVTTALGEVKDIMMLAGATSSDLGEAFKMSALQMRIFGVEADRAGDIADVLATGMLKAAYVSLEDLNTSMRYASPTAAAFGYNMQQATASAMAFMNVIGQSSMAGTQFRMALMKLMGGSSKVQKVLDKYSITVKDVNNNARDFGEIIDDIAAKGVTPQEIVRMFGARASTGMLALVQGAKKGVNGYKLAMAELDKASGMSSNIYADMMDTMVGAGMRLKSQWSELRLTFMDFFGSLPQMFVGSMADALQKINFSINAAQDAFKDNVEYLKKFVVNLADYLTTYIPSKTKAIGANLMLFFNDIREGMYSLQGLAADVWDAFTMGQNAQAEKMRDNAIAGIAKVEKSNKLYEAQLAKANAEIGEINKKEYPNFGGLTLKEQASTMGGLLSDIMKETAENYNKKASGEMGVKRKAKGGEIEAIGGAVDPATVQATSNMVLGDTMIDASNDTATLGKSVGNLSASAKGASKALSAMVENMMPARMEKRKNSADRIREITEKRAQRMIDEGTTTGTVDWGKSRREREKPQKAVGKDEYQLGYEERQKSKEDKRKQSDKEWKYKYRRGLPQNTPVSESDMEAEKITRKKKRLEEIYGKELKYSDINEYEERYKKEGAPKVSAMDNRIAETKRKRNNPQTMPNDKSGEYDSPKKRLFLENQKSVIAGNNLARMMSSIDNGTAYRHPTPTPNTTDDYGALKGTGFITDQDANGKLKDGSNKLADQLRIKPSEPGNGAGDVPAKLEDLTDNETDIKDKFVEYIDERKKSNKITIENYDKIQTLEQNIIQVTQTNIDTTSLLIKRVKALESMVSRMKSAVA